MFEKVNPSHPDKIADRIAGAIVDLAYAKEKNPKVAIEVLIGHGVGYVTGECSCNFNYSEIYSIVHRIAPNIDKVISNIVKQDTHLANNQFGAIRCGDNGIFKGVPVTDEQKTLSSIAHDIYKCCPYDGKYIINNDDLIICQSNISNSELTKMYPNAKVNPIGEWTGGSEVDAGATNRKLGSDMADSVTGSGLHGKDLSKADVSINIYAWLKAQETNEIQNLYCAIGDELVDGRPYSEIVEIAKNYINNIGGFEKFAEWGLV